MVEWLLIIGLFLGVFSSIALVKLLHYILCISVQIVLIIRWMRNRCTREPLMIYLRTLFLIGLIAISFYVLKVDFVTGLNRICPLVAIYGVVIVGDKHLNVDIDFIIKHLVRLYIGLSIVINLDALCYVLFGSAIWPPISYLGARYIGPTGDANYLAFWSASFFIIVLYNDGLQRREKRIGLITLLVNVLIAGSLSVYILLPASILGSLVWKEKNLRRKQSCILFLYIIFLFIYGVWSEEIREIGVGILEKILQSSDNAEIKYKSLALRLDTQWKALQIFIKEWWGQGPRQIVPQLGRDTHNSYVAIVFELGLLGCALFMSTLKNSNNSNILVRTYSLFIMLNALLLDAHYLSLYSLLLILQYWDKKKIKSTNKIVLDSKTREDLYVQGTNGKIKKLLIIQE